MAVSQIRCQLFRGKVILGRYIFQRERFSYQDGIGGIEGADIVVLKNGPS